MLSARSGETLCVPFFAGVMGRPPFLCVIQHTLHSKSKKLLHHMIADNSDRPRIVQHFCKITYPATHIQPVHSSACIIYQRKLLMPTLVKPIDVDADAAYFLSSSRAQKSTSGWCTKSRSSLGHVSVVAMKCTISITPGNVPRRCSLSCIRASILQLAP